MIKLRNISKYYSKNQVVSLGLRKIDLEFGLNEFVAIVGESGSGKTTLLNVISGIDSYEEGEMYINNEETSYFSKADWENYRKKYIAFIFQSYHLIESYTVLQNVEAALILSGYPKDQVRSRALEIINRVGLTDFIKHKATKLSGGQKQRVVIARAIAKDAPIIVADEPTGNLDSESAKNIIDLLAEIAKDKLVIVVTHDYEQVASQATRRIRIFDGEIVEDKKIKKVEPKALPSLEDKDYKMNFLETIKMVFRNLFATPKKSLLLLVVFLFTTFFFAFIYAGFLQNQASQSSSSALNYEPDTRMLVKKTDGTAFTDDEILSLEANRRVESVVTYDFLFDSRFSVNFNYEGYNSGSGSSLIIMPQSMIDGLDQLEGNEAYYSASDPEYRLDSIIFENIEDSILTLRSNNAEMSFDIKSFIYYDEMRSMVDDSFYQILVITDENWQALGKAYAIGNFTFIDYEYTYSGFKTGGDLAGYDIYRDSTLSDNQMVFPSYLFYGIYGNSVSADIDVQTIYKLIELEDIEVFIYGTNEIMISPNIYDQLFPEDEIFQVSLFAYDDIDALNLVDSLRSSGDYIVFHPASAESASQLEGLIFLVMNFGFVVLFVIMFIVIFFVAYMIIKNIINSKLSDYAIFRTIGANKTTIRSFIYLETIFVAIVAYIIFVLTVVIGDPYFVEESLLYVLKFYTLKNIIYLMIFIIFFSTLLSRRYLSRVYHDTVAETLRREME